MTTTLKSMTAADVNVPLQRTAASLPAVLAIVFGVFMVFGTGLAQSSALHNAAHDVRHAFAFPCH